MKVQDVRDYFWGRMTPETRRLRLGMGVACLCVAALASSWVLLAFGVYDIGCVLLRPSRKALPPAE